MEETIRVYVLGPREDGFYSPLIKKRWKEMWLYKSKSDLHVAECCVLNDTVLWKIINYKVY